MRTIGLIGGMSWVSTAQYYAMLNTAIRERRGALHSAPIVMWSVDFAPIERMQREGRWDEAAHTLADIARRLERAGAEALVLCTNTMHRVADAIDAAASIPLIHIADATATTLRHDGHTTIGLLGTAFTMEQTFYRERLRERFGLNVLVPDDAQRAEVHRVIYEELCDGGRIVPRSKAYYRDVMHDLAARGAQAIALACTEIMLLVDAADAPVPLYDTTAEHVRAAVDFIDATQP